MVYIYKRATEGKPYYYLRTSKRVKDKVIAKDIAYLGNDLTKIEKKLDSLPQQYKAEIRKAHRNIKKFITSEYLINKIKEKKLKKTKLLLREFLEQVEAIKFHYQNHFLKEDELTQKESYKQFLVGFAYNSTSLEGNTITLKEAERLLHEELSPKDRTLREIYDLQNTEKVFFDLLESKEEITNKLIIKIHDQLMEKIDKRMGYRLGDIRVFRSRFDASPGKYVKADMNILLDWYKKEKKNLHPMVMAAIFHQKFEKIHPFSDGNGRTGRMLMNYMLLNSGFPPMIIQKKNRSTYLDVLGQANDVIIDHLDEKKYKGLVEFVVEEMVANYWNLFLV